MARPASVPPFPDAAAARAAADLVAAYLRRQPLTPRQAAALDALTALRAALRALEDAPPGNA